MPWTQSKRETMASDRYSANVKGAGRWLAAHTLRRSPDHADPPTAQELFMLSVEIEDDAAVTKDRVQNAKPTAVTAFISRTFEACKRARNSLSHRLKPVLALSKQESPQNKS